MVSSLMAKESMTALVTKGRQTWISRYNSEKDPRWRRIMLRFWEILVREDLREIDQAGTTQTFKKN